MRRADVFRRYINYGGEAAKSKAGTTCFLQVNPGIL
jgi:hypothetical protein